VSRVVALLLATALHAAAATAAAQPRIELRIPGFDAAVFDNHGVVSVPATATDTLEVWFLDVLAPLQISTLRVRLNDMPMTPFVSTFPLPRGLRVVVRLGATLHPDYQLRTSGENVLFMTVIDQQRASYEGRFTVAVDSTAEAPRGAVARSAVAPVSVVAAPVPVPPVIRLLGEWPASTRERTVTLDVQVEDPSGLLRVVIEVNGKDVQEVVLQNGLPVRKENGWVARGRVPGEVVGDSQRLHLSIPVRLTRDINVIAVRAENTGNLRTRATHSVERVR
jgi:hypothetical protein